jgi:hypothetical protein
MNTQVKTLEELEAQYRRRKLEIRADATLSWEKKELSVKALSDEYYRQRRKLEEAA